MRQVGESYGKLQSKQSQGARSNRRELEAIAGRLKQGRRVAGRSRQGRRNAFTKSLVLRSMQGGDSEWREALQVIYCKIRQLQICKFEFAIHLLAVRWSSALWVVGNVEQICCAGAAAEVRRLRREVLVTAS